MKEILLNLLVLILKSSKNKKVREFVRILIVKLALMSVRKGLIKRSFKKGKK